MPNESTASQRESAPEDPFISHLLRMADQDKGALAALRRSLSFEPGTFVPSFPHVEPWVATGTPSGAWRRRSLYLLAGIFASHPHHDSRRSFARAYADSQARRDSSSMIRRFTTLLDADEAQLGNRLRSAVQLIAADGVGFDYGYMLRDLRNWQHGDRWVQQDWARDFFRSTEPTTATEEV
jgi:CRISPR system Cascade subunit CasB